ncbi:MAG TPA: PEGA domain-containing protein [Thermoplasmata archaeon]
MTLTSGPADVSIARRLGRRPSSLGVALMVVIVLCLSVDVSSLSGVGARPPFPAALGPTTAHLGSVGPMPDHPFLADPPTAGGAGDWTRGDGTASQPLPNYRLSTTPLASELCQPDYARAWLAYDPAIQSFWIAAPPSCVVAVSMTQGSVTVSVPVGGDPFGVAVDNATHQVFVTNSGSNNVTVVSDQTYLPVASIPVGTTPYGVAFDWATGDVYVANGGSDNVSVISGTTLAVVATVDVGSSPIGVVSDPESGKVYVADYGSGNVSVISDTSYSVVAVVPAGLGPYGIALDNDSNRIFVTNSGSNNLTVIDATTDSLITSIPVIAPGISLEGVAYDAAERQVWAGGGESYAVIVDATNLSLVGFLSFDPAGVAYDPDTGSMCVTNTANFTFACLTSRRMVTAFPLTFSESGLPAGIPWAVTIAGPGTTGNATVTLAARNISFGFWPFFGAGDYSYWIPPTHGYFVSPSNGTVSAGYYSAVVNVSFAPAYGTYAVDFAASGLPVGTRWSVDLDGTYNGSVSPFNSFRAPNGTYPFNVSPLAHFAPTPASGELTVAGSDLAVAIQFAPIPWFTVWFNETGLPTGTNWSVDLHGIVGRSTAGTNSFTEPNGTYAFTIGSVGGYSVVPDSGNVFVRGQPVVILLTWSQIRLDASFLASGLPGGTLWSVTLDGLLRTSRTPSIDFSEPAGHHGFTIGGVFDYRTVVETGAIDLSVENVSVPVPWTHATYPARFNESGLPAGLSWGVDLVEPGQFLNATATGSTVSFDLPNGSYSFTIRGPAEYSAAPSVGEIALAGTDRDVSIRFVLSGSVAGSVTPTSASILIGGAVVPLAAGRFNVGEIPGTYPVEVSEPGYAPYFANVTVQSGRSTWLNVSLEAAASSSGTILAGALPFALAGFAVGALIGGLAVGVWGARRRHRAPPVTPLSPKTR